jgi:hypothetical protein
MLDIVLHGALPKEPDVRRRTARQTRLQIPPGLPQSAVMPKGTRGRLGRARRSVSQLPSAEERFDRWSRQAQAVLPRTRHHPAPAAIGRAQCRRRLRGFDHGMSLAPARW